MRRFLPLTLAAALVLPALPALAGPIDSAVNGSRGTSLPSRADLDAKAHGSAANQAANLQIAHASLVSLGDICSAAGEIVGMGPTVSVVFDLFLNSPSHREILLSPVWSAIGTGAVTGSDGNIYVSVVFCKEIATSTSPTSTVPPPTAPNSTAPASTVAPTSPTRTAAANPASPAVSIAGLQEVFLRLLLGELDDLWLFVFEPEGWWSTFGPSPFLPRTQWMAPTEPMIT